MTDTGKALVKNAAPLTGGGVIGAALVYLVTALANPQPHNNVPESVTKALADIASEQRLLRQEMSQIKDAFHVKLQSESQVWSLKWEALESRVSRLEAAKP